MSVHTLPPHPAVVEVDGEIHATIATSDGFDWVGTDGFRRSQTDLQEIADRTGFVEYEAKPKPLARVEIRVLEPLTAVEAEALGKFAAVIAGSGQIREVRA